MTTATENMYKASIKDTEFQDELISSDPINYIKPKLVSSDKFKVIYTAIYYGWLVGKGRYTEGMFK